MVSTDRQLCGWNREQWITILTLCATHFCNGMCVSLQAPFYPHEAEKKGATASEYGLVFGVFELVVFIVSPIVGKYLPKIGAHKAFSMGIFTTGSMCLVFGFLDRFQQPSYFIGFSLLVRIIEAVGNAAFLTASFSLVAQYFPDSVATVFSLVEMSFGIGMILGPTVGGILYEKGGFTLPFAVLGAILITQATFATFSFKKVTTNTEPASSQLGIFGALKIPRVALATLSVFSASISVGSLQATLERHLAQFDLSAIQVGLFFMVYGAAYALPNPMWGWMADKICPRLVIFVGASLLSTGYILVGPLPLTGLTASYNLIMGAVVISGVGLGAQLVAAFTEAQKCALNAGCANDVTTYSLVSSIWTSAFALGAFAGPTVAGVLYDKVGFPWSTLFPISCNALVAVLTLIGLIVKYSGDARRRYRQREYRSIKGYDEIDRRRDSYVSDYGYKSDSEDSLYNCTVEIQTPPAVRSLRYPFSASTHGLESPGGADVIVHHYQQHSFSNKSHDYQSI